MGRNSQKRSLLYCSSLDVVRARNGNERSLRRQTILFRRCVAIIIQIANILYIKLSLMAQLIWRYGITATLMTLTVRAVQDRPRSTHFVCIY